MQREISVTGVLVSLSFILFCIHLIKENPEANTFLVYNIWYTNEKPAETPEATMPKSAARKTQFGGFTYNKDNLNRQGAKE